MEHTTSTPKNEVIQYKLLRDSTAQWHELLIIEGFKPRDADFEHLYFKINGIVYTEPSETFYLEFNKAVMWLNLQVTDSIDESFIRLGSKHNYFGYSTK